MTRISKGENKFQSKNQCGSSESQCVKSEHWVSGDAPRALVNVQHYKQGCASSTQGTEGPCGTEVSLHANMWPALQEQTGMNSQLSLLQMQEDRTMWRALQSLPAPVENEWQDKNIQ